MSTAAKRRPHARHCGLSSLAAPLFPGSADRKLTHTTPSPPDRFHSAPYPDRRTRCWVAARTPRTDSLRAVFLVLDTPTRCPARRAQDGTPDVRYRRRCGSPAAVQRPVESGMRHEVILGLTYAKPCTELGAVPVNTTGGERLFRAARTRFTSERLLSHDKSIPVVRGPIASRWHRAVPLGCTSRATARRGSR
jgi:hypothetical protein